MQATVERIIDRIQLKWLLISYATWIVFFAVIFWITPRFVSAAGPALGDGSVTTSFISALLFSFSTATNTGVGDMHAVGIAQLFAAIEITGGIVFAGIAINLLAIMPSKKTRLAEKACKGWWIEEISIPEVSNFYSITFMARNGDVLRKNGYNFHPDDGHMNRTTFLGQVITAYFPTLISKYKNDALSKEYSEGYFQFELEIGPNGEFNSYKGVCFDRKHGGRDRIVGRRIAAAELVQALNEHGQLTNDQHDQLIRTLFPR